MLETPYEKLVRSNSEFCEENLGCNIRDVSQEFVFDIDDSNKMGLFMLRLQAEIDEHIKKARVEIIRQIARESDVSFTLAEWWFNKNMKLVVDLEKEEIRSEFLSVDERLANIEVETEYDREMEKELMESTLGKVKKGD